MPKVSVNIPCFNGQKYIAETLQSVLDQTYQDFEVILVNDGSTDRTEEIVKGFCDDRIRYYYQDNMGLARTRNRLLELSNGEFVAFLDQDDLWMPAKLEKQIPLFKKNPKVGLVYSRLICLNDEGYTYQLSRRKKMHRGYVFGELLKGNFLPVQGTVIRREVLSALGEWFDERFSMAEDADLFMRIAHDYEVDYVDEPLAKRRMHKESLSHTRRDLVFEEEKILINKLKDLYPTIKEEFGCELRLMESQIYYKEALACWADGKSLRVRQLLRPFLSVDRRLFLPYILSCFSPYCLYTFILKLCGKYVYTPS